MNFKKFISGISALTIAASAFAGLAVTASAANSETTYTNVAPSEDTYATYKDTEDTDHSGDTTLAVNWDNRTNFNNASGGWSEVPIMKFNLSDVDITGAESAKLKLYIDTAYNSASLKAYTTANTDWTASSINKSNLFTSVGSRTWNANSAAMTGSATELEITLDKAKLNTAKSENGYVSILIGNSTGHEVRFYSVDAEEEAKRPQLVFAYTPKYDVTLTTTPYAKATVNDTVYYSGASGVISLGQGETGDEYSYTIEKGGYVKKSDTATVNGEALAISAALTKESGILYKEDFNTVSSSDVVESLGNDTTASQLFSINAKYGTMTLTADNADLEIYNGGGGFRSVSYPLSGVSTYNFEFNADVTFAKDCETQLILRDSANQVYASINVSTSGVATLDASGANYNTFNSSRGAYTTSIGSITTGEAVNVDIKVDTSKGVVRASIGDKSAKITGFSKDDPRGSYNNLNSIMIGSTRYFKTTIDNIVVTSYSEPTATVTIDGVSATYLIDAEITLPDTYDTWTDGVNQYAAGATYIVTGDATLTEYTAPASAPIVNNIKAVSFTPADDGITAKAFTFDVTGGTYEVTSVIVTPAEGKSDSFSTSISTGTTVTFGVVFAARTENAANIPTELTTSMINASVSVD